MSMFSFNNLVVHVKSTCRWCGQPIQVQGSICGWIWSHVDHRDLSPFGAGRTRCVNQEWHGIDGDYKHAEPILRQP